MRFYKYSLLVLLSVFLAPSVHGQQSIQLTQYIFNSMSVNPAYAGYKEEWFAQVALRDQWSGWPGAPRTGAISIDGILDPVHKRFGAGLQVTSDRLGAQGATSIYGNYAFRLQLNAEDTQRLSFGIAGGATQYSLDGNKIDPVDGSDVVLPTGRISSWHPDIRLGVYYYNPKWYLGVSVQDLFSGGNKDYVLNQNTVESLYKEVNMYLMTGFLFTLSDNFHFRPSLLIKDDFKGPTTGDVNAMFVFSEKLWIGAGYRTRTKLMKRDYEERTASKLSSMNAVSGIIQLYLTPSLRIGYSYDAMLNKMSSGQNGTHEVTLGVTFGKRDRQILSPRFF